jgi:hypothetical protein
MIEMRQATDSEACCARETEGYAMDCSFDYELVLTTT